MVICLERGADLHMAQLMPLLLTVSCFSKIQIGFTFLVPAHPSSPEKGTLNGFVCVCACVRACVWADVLKVGGSSDAASGLQYCSSLLVVVLLGGGTLTEADTALACGSWSRWWQQHPAWTGRQWLDAARPRRRRLRTPTSARQVRLWSPAVSVPCIS